MAYAISKYHNVKVEVDGYRFDSRAEAQRWQELKLRLYNREITDLLVHPNFVLNVGNMSVGTYVGDFQYVTLPDYQMVVEDVKGVRTAVYRLKKKLMKALYRIDITEIEA